MHRYAGRHARRPLTSRDRLPGPEATGAPSASRSISPADSPRPATGSPCWPDAGTRLPEAAVVELPPKQAGQPRAWISARCLPAGLDILSPSRPSRRRPEVPWIRSLHGNRSPARTSAPNTLYLSRDHATRHGGTAFVYNGIDLAEFRFRASEGATTTCSWAGCTGSRAIAGRSTGPGEADAGSLLGGGWRPSFRPSIRYVGQVGGERKAELLAGAACLWMPALWDEPFGLTLIEALASGTPVLGTRRGALPRSSPPDVGALGDTLDELVALRPAPRPHRPGGLPRAGRASLHPSRDGGGVPADVPGVSGDAACCRREGRRRARGRTGHTGRPHARHTPSRASVPAPPGAARPDGACRCARRGRAAARRRPPARPRRGPAAPPR